MESFRLVHTFYHYLAEIGSLYKTYGSREHVGPPLELYCQRYQTAYWYHTSRKIYYNCLGYCKNSACNSKHRCHHKHHTSLCSLGHQSNSRPSPPTCTQQQNNTTVPTTAPGHPTTLQPTLNFILLTLSHASLFFGVLWPTGMILYKTTATSSIKEPENKHGVKVIVLYARKLHITVNIERKLLNVLYPKGTQFEWGRRSTCKLLISKSWCHHRSCLSGLARLKDTQQFIAHFVFGDRFALSWPCYSLPWVLINSKYVVPGTHWTREHVTSQIVKFKHGRRVL